MSRMHPCEVPLRRLHIGDWAYLRVRVAGPGRGLSGEPAAAVQLVDRVGRPVIDAWLYVPESELITPADAFRAATGARTP